MFRSMARSAYDRALRMGTSRELVANLGPHVVCFGNEAAANQSNGICASKGRRSFIMDSTAPGITGSRAVGAWGKPLATSNAASNSSGGACCIVAYTRVKLAMILSASGSPRARPRIGGSSTAKKRTTSGR